MIKLLFFYNKIYLLVVFIIVCYHIVKMTKTIIISDLHLSIFINKKHFKTLKGVFQSADKIILNGDIFDNYWNYQKVAKKWQNLLKILKEKEVIYLFGNHDPKSEKLLKVVNTFTKNIFENYNLKVGEREFVIMHGHTIAPSLDRFYLDDGKDTFFEKIFGKFIYILWKTIYPLRHLIFYFFSFFGKYFKELKSSRNDLMKKYAKEKIKENQILVCGHSHQFEFNLKEKFINTGEACFKKVSYLEIDENGSFNLVKKMI